MSKYPMGYVPIRTSSLNSQWALKMDVFVPVNGEAVKFSDSGEPLEAERLQKLKRHKFTKVLIRAHEETLYRKFLEEIMNEAANNKKMEMDKRAQVMTGQAETSAQQVMENPADKGIYIKAQEIFSQLGTFLTENPNASKEILKLSNGSQQDHVTHGIRVAAIALKIAELANQAKAPEARLSLMTAAALHDLGLERLGVPFKPHSKFTPEELEKWKQHPTNLGELFKDKDFMNRLTLDLIMEHEELPNGDGFPNKLTGPRMNPMSISLSLANRYEYHARELGDNPDPKEVMKQFTMNELGHFDLSWIELLKKALA